jgi:hypothetical protein
MLAGLLYVGCLAIRSGNLAGNAKLLQAFLELPGILETDDADGADFLPFAIVENDARRAKQLEFGQ